MAGKSKIVRIGGAGGFLGDSQVAAPQLLAVEGLDYLVLDYLAEATLSLLARSQRKHPQGGYAVDFTDWVWKDNLHALKEKRVKIVTNAGGLNPIACRDRMKKIAAEAGVDLRIAVVTGDDFRERLGELRAGAEMFSGEAFPAAEKVLSANAYLGAAPIAAALKAGADVVVTGRVVDSALVLGPLIHEFAWRLDDYDRLAMGSLCGHVLECGAQATGGLFTDWERVPDWAHIGYPVAECAEDGSFVVTKPEGTGGLCEPATVAEQVLYEVGDPQAYALPDVVCDFSNVRVESVGDQRVRVTGAVGRPPSGSYKVCTTWEDGHRLIWVMPIVGRDAARKARRQAAAVIERVEELLRARNIAPFRATRIEPLGAETTYGAQARAGSVREVACRIGVEHDDETAFNVLMREMESPATSMSVGTTGWFGARPQPGPVVRVFSSLIPADRVPARIEVEGETLSAPSPVHADATPPAPPHGEAARIDPSWPSAPLIALAYARSGDKGDAFNIGVIAREPDYLPYIRAALTEARVLAFFAHEFEGAPHPEVRRYEVPGLNALNFHLLQSLGGGQMATLRLDALAKGKAQQLLDCPVPVPPGVYAKLNPALRDG